MKKLLIVLFLLFPVRAQAAWSLVAHNSAFSAAGNTVSTSNTNCSGANFGAIYATFLTGATVTPSDNGMNTWNALTGVGNAGAGLTGKWYYSVLTSVSSTQTFTITCTACFPGVVAFCFSGGHATTPFDSESGATSTTGATTAQPGSITPAEDNELFLLGFSDNIDDAAAWAINSSFTLSESVPSSAFSGGSNFAAGGGYKIQTSAGAENPTWTFRIVSGPANGGSIVMSTFKSASAPPSGIHTFGTLGVGK